jgi:hypothetical protein
MFPKIGFPEYLVNFGGIKIDRTSSNTRILEDSIHRLLTGSFAFRMHKLCNQKRSVEKAGDLIQKKLKPISIE